MGVGCLHSLFHLLLLFLLLASSPSSIAQAAYVQTYTCGDSATPPKPLSQGGPGPFNQLSNPIAEVALVGHQMFYRLEFSPLTTISDLNRTTSLYSTLNVEWKYMVGDSIKDSFRLCEYAFPASDNYTLSSILSDQNSSLLQEFKNTENGAIHIPSSSQNHCPLVGGGVYNLFYSAKLPKLRFMGSYNVKFTIYNSEFTNFTTEDSFGCVMVYPTLELKEKMTYPVSFSVIIIFILGFVSTYYIFTHSLYQETTNLLLIIASSICNEPLLNELTPDLIMFLKYLQFALFSTGLNIDYPGFKKPLMVYTNWVVLMRVDIFSSMFVNPLATNGIYDSLGRQGLFGLFPQGGFKLKPDGETISHIYANFIIWIWCSIALLIIISQLYLTFKQYVQKDHNNTSTSLKERFFYALGIVIQFFYSYFSLPFITFSSFLIFGLIHNSLGNLEISTIYFGIFFYISWIMGLAWFIIYIILKNKNKLYSSSKVISCWSSIYYYYKPRSSFFVIIEELKIVFQGVVIGAGGSNGAVQVGLLSSSELVYLMCLMYYQPNFNRARNIWGCVLSFICVVLSFLSIAYITELNVSMVVRSLISYIQVFLTLIVSLAFLGSFIYKSIKVFKSRRSKHTIGQQILRNDKQRPPFNNRGHQRQGSAASTSSVPEFDFEVPQESMNYIPLSTNENNFSSRLDTEQKPATSYIPEKYTQSRTSVTGYPMMLAPPVSPINDEYLARMGQTDSEVRKLWAARRNKLKRLSTNLDEHLKIFKRKSSIEDGTGDSGNRKSFAVMGRKDIVISGVPNDPRDGTVEEQYNDDDDDDDDGQTRLIKIPEKSRNRTSKVSFLSWSQSDSDTTYS